MIISVSTSTGKYNIYIKRGILNSVGELFKLDRKVLIVTDSGVPKRYSETVASQCEEPYTVVIKQGEASKCFENYKLLLSKMVQCGFTRSDCVVAVGGGVVGDLAGFVASSYMRGVDFYNIPTTVLSQVDSSIGGKVAIDFDGYKNIVGAFYPPMGVLIDSDTLSTLPKRQISNGLAESVKMALTSDKELFEIFENGNAFEDIDEIIIRSLRIKKAVVEADEKESGLRKILNFGHTLAHAIESQNKMDNLYHGECVALGMLPMCGDEVRKRLIKVLKSLDLPCEFRADKDVIFEAIKHDKKMSGNKIMVIYVPNVGEYSMRTIGYNDIKELLNGVI